MIRVLQVVRCNQGGGYYTYTVELLDGETVEIDRLRIGGVYELVCQRCGSTSCEHVTVTERAIERGVYADR